MLRISFVGSLSMALAVFVAQPTNVEAQPVTAAASKAGGKPGVQRCGDIVLKGSKALFATRPRADRDAEALALQSSGALVAPDDQYRRFTADLAAIRKAYPKPGARGVGNSAGTQTLIIEVPQAQLDLAAKGEYKALDCLNEWYGGRIHNVLTAVRMMIVRFSTLYHVTHLVDAYSGHPDMRLVEADTMGGSGDDIRFCNESFGGVHRYIFQKGSGDCMSGCLEIRYRGYDVTPEGRVTRLESWTGRTFRGRPDPPPAWVLPGCDPKKIRRYFLSPERKTD